jgi:hypothetical protein
MGRTWDGKRGNIVTLGLDMEKGSRKNKCSLKAKGKIFLFIMKFNYKDY